MYTVNITIDQIMDALGAFMQPFVGSTKIIRSQVNRVPPPHGSFVQLTELLQADIDVPYSEYTIPVAPIPALGKVTVIGPTRLDVQIDFYGNEAADWCKAFKNIFRSAWGFDNFPSIVKPLYTSDANQHPLVSGEEQYVSRWTLTLSMQYNPTVELPQGFAEVLTANPVILANTP